MTLKANGSGTLALTYRVSQLVAELGASSTGRAAIPLPLSRGDFDRTLEAARGKVRLASFSRSENEKDITIRVEMSFDSFDALAQVEAFRDAELKLTSDGSRTTFSQVVARKPGEPVSNDSLQMIDALFEGYDLSFAFAAPAPIQSVGIGKLSADKRELTYTASVREIMTTGNDLILTASW